MTAVASYCWLQWIFSECGLNPINLEAINPHHCNFPSRPAGLPPLSSLFFFFCVFVHSVECFVHSVSFYSALPPFTLFCWCLFLLPFHSFPSPLLQHPAIFSPGTLPSLPPLTFSSFSRAAPIFTLLTIALSPLLFPSIPSILSLLISLACVPVEWT